MPIRDVSLLTEAEARAKLKYSYDRFMELPDAAREEDAGKNLIRAIFGREAVG